MNYFLKQIDNEFVIENDGAVVVACTHYPNDFYPLISQSKEEIMEMVENIKIKKLAEETIMSLMGSKGYEGILIKAFILGYESNPAKYIEEQMGIAINLSWSYGKDGEADCYDKIIKAIQPPFTGEVEIEKQSDGQIKITKIL